jgi:hypothetical protein
MEQKTHSGVQKFTECCKDLLFRDTTIFSLLHFRFSYPRETRTLNLVFDPKIIEERQIKIESIWSWRKFRNEKFVITNTGEKPKVIKMN